MLKKTSQFLNLDLAYLMKGGSILGAGHTMGTLLGFLLTLLFANFVESTVYGQYKYILSIAGILGALTLSGAATSIMQSVSKGFDGALFREQQLYLKWSLLSVVAACCLGGYYIYKDNLVLGFGIVLATLGNYIYNFLILQSAFLNGKKDFARLSVNQTLNATVLLLAVSAALFFKLDATLWIIGIYYGSQIAYQAFAYRRTLARYKPGINVDASNKNFSAHLSLGNTITYVAEYIDKILIFQFFGAYQVALYAFAVGVPDQIRGVNKVVSSLVVPKLSIKDDAGLEKSVRAHTHKYTIIAVLIVILFYFAAPYIYAIFFPVYIEAAALASLYILLLPITAICTMHGYAIQIRKDVRSLYTIKIIDSVGKIILFIIFIPWLGVLGAIVAVLSSKLFTALVQIGLYHYGSRKGSNE